MYICKSISFETFQESFLNLVSCEQIIIRHVLMMSSAFHSGFDCLMYWTMRFFVQTSGEDQNIQHILHRQNFNQTCEKTTLSVCGPEGYSVKFWVGVCCWDSETSTLYQTMFSRILKPYSRLDNKNLYPIPDSVFSWNSITITVCIP